MQETQEDHIQSLSWEDSLEEEMATHSNILSRKVVWTEEPARLQSTRSQRIRHKLARIHVHYPFNKLILLEEI